MKISSEALAKIRAVVSDVDGVLNDGRIGLGPWPEAIRFFDMRDGMGTKRLQAAGVPIAWLSASIDDGVIRRRAKSLGVDHVDVGVGEKPDRFLALCKAMGVDPADVCYVGDDVNDLPPMKLAGITACPADARPEVIEAVDLVLGAEGGRGAFRELSDMMLRAREQAGSKTGKDAGA